MPKPKTAPNIRNMMMLAFDVAASAASPRKCPTQIVLIDPFSDWRMLLPSVGRAKASRVPVIGPVVRSRWRAIVTPPLPTREGSGVGAVPQAHRPWIATHP